MIPVFACGHTASINSTEEQALQASFRLCPSCSRQDTMVVDGLPALVGTEKQVSFAEGIRADAGRSVLKLNASESAIVKLFQHEFATWWIDTRSIEVARLIRASELEEEYKLRGVITPSKLFGSDRQISWAAGIRSTAFTLYSIILDDLLVSSHEEPNEQLRDAANRLVNRALQYSSSRAMAQIWIDMMPTSLTAAKIDIMDAFRAVARQNSDLREVANRMERRL